MDPHVSNRVRVCLVVDVSKAGVKSAICPVFNPRSSKGASAARVYAFLLSGISPCWQVRLHNDASNMTSPLDLSMPAIYSSQCDFSHLLDKSRLASGLSPPSPSYSMLSSPSATRSRCIGNRHRGRNHHQVFFGGQCILPVMRTNLDVRRAVGDYASREPVPLCQPLFGIWGLSEQPRPDPRLGGRIAWRAQRWRPC